MVPTIWVSAAYLENKYPPAGDERGDSVGKGERDIAKTFRALKVGIEVFWCGSPPPPFPTALRWAISMKKILLTLQKGDVRRFDCH